MGVAVREDRNGDLVYRELVALPEAGTRAIRHAWFDYGKDLKVNANKAILAKPRYGRVYVIRGPSGRRRRHVASRPYESHANMTGRLRRSISWKVRGHTEMTFGYGVSTTALNTAPDYAFFVEFGTSRMVERPSLGNAIEGNDFDRHLLARMRQEFRD
jgi:HK97 gp10 family phage protein